MHQSIRRYRHLILTYAISLGLMTAYMSLLQPIPSASAQQVTGPVSQEISGTGTQGRRIENLLPPFYTQRNPWRRRTRKPRPASHID